MVDRTSTSAALGITHISFYPFDSLAFLTSGYDHTVKLFSSETLAVSAFFDLESIVYSHAMSTMAPHLLVACASQHPAVRLVDLNSGAYTHSLAGHAGNVLAVAWHPKEEHVLASAATDGVIRLWDIRKSANSLGVLDMDDSIGIVGYDGHGTGARRRERGKAHRGAVNGLVWTEDGRHLVSVGHDECMRVWDMISGANTLANFGPALKNATTTSLLPLIAPRHISKSGGSTLIYYPNPKEILSFDLDSGSLQKRLRVPNRGAHLTDRSQSATANARNLKNRTTSLAWRPHHSEMYSAHGDGTIRCWQPRTREDVWADDADDDKTGEEAEARKRKREEFDQIVRDLTRKKVTFN
jgi:DNA excision repair protein ERCC-8